MAATNLGKRKRPSKHPYLSGNFAPQDKTCPLTPCNYTGTIPEELVGGQYVRNGTNPVSNADLGRDAHWFDGDGMLSGVSFARNDQLQRGVQPEFVNQYVLTDVYLSSISTPALKGSILPSISTFVNPLSTFFRICMVVFRSLFIVILSRLPGSQRTIKKISVANTAILYHDGRALATCESGPPMRVSLPSLDTIGWYNGQRADGEPEKEVDGQVFGGEGLMSFMREWTTAHPKVDPNTNELLLFHSTPAPPFVNYSVVPADQSKATDPAPGSRLINGAVAGIKSGKMMHDFGVSSAHTVIMDLPLSLDLLRLAKGNPVISYDSTIPSRFGVFPRREPGNVRWFETAACCIFHTANTWDVMSDAGHLRSVDMLACRMTTATVVFAAGNIEAPQPTKKALSTTNRRIGSGNSDQVDHPAYEKTPLIGKDRNTHVVQDCEESEADVDEEDDIEQCRLYYYSFDMRHSATENKIAHQFGLSAIPFEFPSTNPTYEMSAARYVYGCTSTNETFNSALGRAATIDGLVKFDVKKLITKGKRSYTKSVTGCVDIRTIHQVLESKDPQEAIQIFKMPPHIYGGEPRFVPAANPTSEDDGFLVVYMFDERQLNAEGEALPNARSELWIIDAKGMCDVLAKVQLPQRVPYGLHGHWFAEDEVLGQRAVESVRSMPQPQEEDQRRMARMGRWVTDRAIRAIGG